MDITQLLQSMKKPKTDTSVSTDVLRTVRNPVLLLMTIDYRLKIDSGRCYFRLKISRNIRGGV